jgi:uncharacterized integral membrane protein
MKIGHRDRSTGAVPPPPPDVAPGANPPGHGKSVTRPTPSRIGNVWIVSILFAIVLLLLLIFILQNGQKVEISYFGAHGHVPMGVALLLAAVFGILLVALPGSARIVQLRMRDRRRRRLAAREATATPPDVTGPAPGPPAPQVRPAQTPPEPAAAAPATPGERGQAAPEPPSVDQAPTANQPPTELDQPR